MSTPVTVTRIQNRRGTQDQFNALYPVGYNGIGGYGSIVGFTSDAYPNVLLPGEIALCIDSRNAYIGNVNGEYVPFSTGSSSANLADLTPLVVHLAPAGSFTVIPALTYSTTPFNTILYDITDSIDANWNLPGSNFSRNGRLEITATSTFSSVPAIPPYPPVTPVTLNDIGTEINLVYPNSIDFIAQYDVTTSNIEILYTHNFSGTLTFSTTSISWVAF